MRATPLPPLDEASGAAARTQSWRWRVGLAALTAASYALSIELMRAWLLDGWSPEQRNALIVVTALALLVPPSSRRAAWTCAWPVRALGAGAVGALGMVAVVALVTGLRGGSPLHPITRQCALLAGTYGGLLAIACGPCLVLVRRTRTRATRVAAVGLACGVTLLAVPAVGAVWSYGSAALTEGPQAGILALGRWLQRAPSVAPSDVALAAPATLTVLFVALRVPTHGRVLGVCLAAAWIARALHLHDAQLWIVRPLDDEDRMIAQFIGGGVPSSSPSDEVIAELELLPLLSVVVPLAHAATSRPRQTRVTVAPWTGPNEPREDRS